MKQKKKDIHVEVTSKNFREERNNLIQASQKHGSKLHNHVKQYKNLNKMYKQLQDYQSSHSKKVVIKKMTKPYREKMFFTSGSDKML